MTSATERVRKLHHRGNLISSTQLADARQPKADASRQAVADNAQRIDESHGMSPKEALASVVKRRKCEQRNNWAQLQRATRCWLPESQSN
ncbi:hypothetical protein [Synechococcus sp. CC9616]|uniref:hypothetical protein n=1 Tax=Synechococcus sp. CC9616 TaxID=110663 RepID=UPI000490A315|nr:hypothetical protein [Synechococcus sp. CC9616]